MDRWGNRSLLTNSHIVAPSNILYAQTAMGAVVVVLDSIAMKVFDTTGVYLGAIAISGAKQLCDAVYDDSTATFYTTDIENGVIYKTTLGAGPNYVPTTSVLASGIYRPTSLILQKNKKQLWLVQDTLQSGLLKVELGSGAISLIKNTGLNNVWGLAIDGQGNLYLASQGDKNIYQWNKYLSGSPRKLVGEPKPGDITVNIAKDEWAYCCIICGNVYISKLHTFGPAIEVSACAGDSIEVYRNTLIKQVGTFETNNQFVLEMSSPWGNFDTAKILGVYNDTLVPALVKVNIPTKSSYSLQYKYRYRSTAPAINGLAERMYIYDLPALEWKGATLYYCPNDTLHILRQTYDWERNFWSMNGEFLDSNEEHTHVPAPLVGTLKLELHSTHGCVATDSAKVKQYAVIKPILSYRSKDSVVKSSEMGIEYIWYTPKGIFPTIVPFIPNHGNGNYMLCMRDFEGCKICSDTFQLQLSSTASVEHSSIQLNPNPAKSKVQLRNLPATSLVNIINLQGQVAPANLYGDELDISMLLPGKYWVEVITNQGAIKLLPFVVLE